MTTTSPAKIERNRIAIRIWLGIVTLAIFALVIVGGATRLTDSGLSITEWKPVHGVIPPLNEADWEEEFQLYQQIPEYQQINKGMSLSEFKYIYWWEWAHRILARGVGVLFGVPLLVFWIAGRIEQRTKPYLHTHTTWIGILYLQSSRVIVQMQLDAVKRFDVIHPELKRDGFASHNLVGGGIESQSSCGRALCGDSRTYGQ